MLDTIQQLITIITAALGLIGTGVSLFFLIKSLIKSRKEKTAQENWNFIMQVAKAGMTKAEESGKKGKEKKDIAIDFVKASCQEAGIDVGPFLDQLFAFIDNSISFANTIK